MAQAQAGVSLKDIFFGYGAGLTGTAQRTMGEDRRAANRTKIIITFIIGLVLIALIVIAVLLAVLMGGATAGDRVNQNVSTPTNYSSCRCRSF